MKIKFLQDYRGVLTKGGLSGELYFKKGAVIDTSKKEYKHVNHSQFVEDGRAKKVVAAKTKE